MCQWKKYIFYGGLEHERVSEIADVFRGAAKMHGFTYVGERCFRQAFSDVVFDGFDIVIGDFLDCDNALRLLFIESVYPRLQHLVFSIGKCADVCELGVL